MGSGRPQATSGGVRKGGSLTKMAAKAKASQPRATQAATPWTSSVGNKSTNAALTSQPTLLTPLGGASSHPFQSANMAMMNASARSAGHCNTSHHNARRFDQYVPLPDTPPRPTTEADILKWMEADQAAKKAEEAAELKRYEEIGTKLTPKGASLVMPQELETMARDPSFKQPRTEWSTARGREIKYSAGQKQFGYTVVSPEYGVVEKDGLYYKLSLENMFNVRDWNVPGMTEEMYKSSRGIVVGYAYLVKGLSWAAQNFGGPLGAAAGPVLDTAVEKALQEDRAAMARLEGREFNEKPIDIDANTLVDVGTALVTHYVGNKVSGATDKAIKATKWAQKASPAAKVVQAIAPRAAGFATDKIIGQGGEITKAAIGGQDISASSFVPSLGGGDVWNLLEGELTSWLGKKWKSGRTPKRADASKASPKPVTPKPSPSKPQSVTSQLTAPPQAQPAGGGKPPRGKPPAGGGGDGEASGKKKSDPEVEAALEAWERLDLEEQGLPKKHDPNEGPVVPAIEHEPLDKNLLARSRARREARREELKSKDKAEPKKAEAKTAETAKDPEKVKAERKAAREKAKYQRDVKNATKADADAEVKRHDDAAQGQEAMTHKDMFNKTIAMRGFEAGASVYHGEQLQKDYDAVKKEIAEHPDKPKLDELQVKKKQVQSELKSIQRKEKSAQAKQGTDVEAPVKLSEADSKKKADLENALKDVNAAIEKNPVSELQSRANSLHDKVAISTLTDPNDPTKLGRGASAGRGDNTYAVIQIVGPDGTIIASATGKRSNKGHAEQNAMPELERQIKARGGVPPGSKVEVVGDQVVCTAICKKDLSKFAYSNNIDSVDGYTFHAEKPGGKGEVYTAKSTAQDVTTTTAEDVTTAKSRDKDLQEKHEPIYRRGEGPLGGGELTEGEKHRHAHTSRTKKNVEPAAKAAELAQPTQQVGEAQGEEPVAKPPAPTKKASRSKQKAAPSGQQQGPAPEKRTPSAPARKSASPSKAKAATPPAKPAPALKIDTQPSPRADVSTPETQQESGGAKPPTPVPAGAQDTPEARTLQVPEQTPEQPAATKPKATKAKSKKAVPAKAPASTKTKSAPPLKPTAQPTHPPSPGGQKITAVMGKADAVLGAVRDYKTYKADGMGEAQALTRSGVTLAANLKGGPAATVVNAANAYDNARRSGQGKVEAMATAIGTGGGAIIADKVAPTGLVGTAVNLANTGAQALGAPQGVQDATAGAAALVPSNIVGTTITEGARSYANLGTALVTGDTKALDKQVQGMQAGHAGPWLQGYAQVTGMVADLAAGDSFDKALNNAADSGKGSWADRVGSKGGDALYELGQSKEAKAGKYGASVQGVAMSLGLASDMIAGDSFEKALAKAADAGKGSWADKAGSALGDVAWTATEKAQELMDHDLPAAKQMIKNQWQKLWS